MISMFDHNSYIDPFDIGDAPESLVNFATGEVATTDIEQSMTTCLERGMKLA